MLLIGVFALVFMLALPASAEPISLAILGAISSSLAASTTAVAITTAIITTIASVAVSYVASALLKSSGQNGGRSMGIPDTSIGSKQSMRQPTAPMQVVYGRTKVAGVYADLWTRNGNQTLYGALVLAGHEIDAVEEIWMNDQQAVLDGAGRITTGRYAGNGTFIPYLGWPDQTAAPILVNDSGGRWTADHRLRGLAYLAFGFYWDNTTGTGNPYYGNFVVSHLGAKVWAGGLPNITAVVRGKKIYDPRTGQTVWSNNSALVVADYLCDTVYGLGVDYATGIDEAALIAAANACDELVTLDGGGTEKRYTTDGFFKVDGTPDAILGKLLGAMHGSAIYDGERWVIQAGVHYEPDAVVITDDDMRAASSLQTLTSTRDIANAVKGTYVGAETKWQPADFPAIVSDTFKAADGGVEKYRDIELPFSSTASRCQRLAKIDLLKQRYETVETFRGKLKCWRYRAGQTVLRTSERYGWTNKAFVVGAVRVVSDQDSEGNPVIGVDLTLYETDASIYNWSTSEEAPIGEPTSPTLPDLYNVLAPTGLSATEIAYTTADGLGVRSKVTLEWTAPQDALVSLGGYYELQYKLNSASTWSALPDTTATTADVLDVAPATYNYRVRAVNYAGNPSTWVGITVTVNGDAAAPEDAAGFTSAGGVSGFTTFSWTAPVYERARNGTAEIRWNAATAGVTWAGATRIASQSARNTEAVLQTKVGTYLLKYRSASGVYSTNAASIVVSTTAQAKVGVEIVGSLPVSDLFEGRVVYLTTDDKLYRYNGSAWTTAVPSTDISGTLADAQIAAVAASKITGQLTDAQLADLSATKVTGLLTNAQIADIASTKITGQLSDTQIAALAATKITGQLTNTQIADVATTKLTGQITTTQITDNAISAPKIAAGAVVAGKIAADAVTSNEIAANAVTAAEIAAGAITTAKIAAGAVTAGEIAANAITSEKINAGAITTAKIAAGAVTAGEIAANAITSEKINAGAITTGKIAAGAVTAGEIAAGAITAAKISAGAVETAAIAAGAIQAGNIAAGAVTAGKIAAGAVTASELAAGAVTADKITAGAVTASKIAVSTLSALSADLGSVTAGTVTGATIQTASSGLRSVMDGTQSDLRTIDPNYASYTYYRAHGYVQPDLLARIGGGGGGYVRCINYIGNISVDGIAMGNYGNVALTPYARGVMGSGDYCGVAGYSPVNVGVLGDGISYDFYALGVGSNYGPFTGSHDALILKDDPADVGDIVIDQEVIAQRSLSNAITRVERSAAANQPGALGVVTRREAFSLTSAPSALIGERDDQTRLRVVEPQYEDLIDTHDRLTVNALGEGLISVCGQGGNIAIGDLIVTSDTPGKGMRQADDIIRGYTVAKAREAATFATPGEVKTIACIYLSG